MSGNRLGARLRGVAKASLIGLGVFLFLGLGALILLGLGWGVFRAIQQRLRKFDASFREFDASLENCRAEFQARFDKKWREADERMDRFHEQMKADRERIHAHSERIRSRVEDRIYGENRSLLGPDSPDDDGWYQGLGHGRVYRDVRLEAMKPGSDHGPPYHWRIPMHHRHW